MKRYSLLPFLLLVALNGFAQQFKVSAKLSGVKQNGLHVLNIGPEFRTLADDNPETIRILDAKGKEVPYFFEYVGDKMDKQNFTLFPTLSKTTSSDTLTSVVIKNISEGRMQNITLAIANNDAIKTYSISGSNDRKEWFGLVNNEELSGMYNPADTKVYKTLAMPPHTYKFIRVDFNDKRSLPLNITEAGVASTSFIPATMQEIIPFGVKTETTGKITKITVRFNHLTQIDNISFKVKSPSYYKRDAKIYVIRQEKHQRKIRNYNDVFEYLELDSSNKNSFNLSNFKQKQFVIEINNNDNQPLNFSAISFYQKPLQVVADLQSAENYTVVAGNKQLKEANYDLANFKDKLPPNLPEIKLLKPTAITPVVKNKQTISQSPLIMWGCIGIGALIVFYFCYSLIKDMKNKPKEDF
jgi:hypothetical protein